jgi:hypothetical protein
MSNIYYKLNNYFLNKFQKIYKFINSDKKPIQLGRWNMNDNHKTNIKIDYANEDHCGTCLIIKNENDKNKEK